MMSRSAGLQDSLNENTTPTFGRPCFPGDTPAEDVQNGPLQEPDACAAEVFSDLGTWSDREIVALLARLRSGESQQQIRCALQRDDVFASEIAKCVAKQSPTQTASSSKNVSQSAYHAIDVSSPITFARHVKACFPHLPFFERGSSGYPFYSTLDTLLLSGQMPCTIHTRRALLEDVYTSQGFGGLPFSSAV